MALSIRIAGAGRQYNRGADERAPMRPVHFIMPRRGAFTLLELLVVVSIIAIIVSITLPAIAGAQAAARRVKCLANLKGIGLAVEVYLNDHEQVLPYALPLDDSRVYGSLPGAHPASPDSILATFGPMMDSPEVLICPSDRDIPPELVEPAGSHSSYEYWAGVLMLAREIFRDDLNPNVSVTRFYENNTAFPVFADSASRHPGGPEYDQCAVYFGDWRADWLSLDPSSGVAQPEPPQPQ
jgi:prepilin-type N-terminal cleavage/methylation domain-containing protein